MRRYCVGLAACLLAVPFNAAGVDTDVAPELPSWMAGCWESRQQDRWAEECWTVPRGGMMMGSGRRGKGGELEEWEVMRIALDEPNASGPAIRMAFLAAPAGRGWTMFGWSPGKEQGVAFYNVTNDYPQVVRYWRDGSHLKARISMADGSKPVEWDYAPMRGD